MNDDLGSRCNIEALPPRQMQSAKALGGVLVETHYHVAYRNALGDLEWEAETYNRVVTAGLNKLLDATFKTGLTTPAWFIGLVGASITDAVMVAGFPQLNSASALFLAVDVGGSIIVRGAGVAGADLVTTVLSFATGSGVVLNANAGTSVVGAKSTWDARAVDTMASHPPWPDFDPYSNATRPAFTPGSIAAGSVSNSGSPAQFTIDVDTSDVFGLFMVDNATVSGTAGTLYGMATFQSPGSQRMNIGGTLTVTATLTMSNG